MVEFRSKRLNCRHLIPGGPVSLAGSSLFQKIRAKRPDQT
jgi:hypothetical protein